MPTGHISRVVQISGSMDDVSNREFEFSEAIFNSGAGMVSYHHVMDDQKNSSERKSKDDGPSSRRVSLSIDKTEKDAMEPRTDHRILFAPDPREKIKHHDEIGILPLTRTFSQNSYSAASDYETARVKRVTSGKAADPGNVLPIGNFRPVEIC